MHRYSNWSQELKNIYDDLPELRIIHLLNDADVLALLQKTNKVYLHHPNLAYSLVDETADAGSQRETFFLNQVGFGHRVNYPDRGDFLVDDKFTFEVGGKSKTASQIMGIDKAWLTLDGIETGHSNTIPLWLFGFLY